MLRNKQFNTKKHLPLIAVLLAVVALIGGFSRANAETVYLIHDEGRISYYTTTETDPDNVLDAFGLVLGIDDTYITEESRGYTGIYVQRVQMVTINNGGQNLITGTYGETVGELLERLGVTVDEDDQISVGMREKTFDGMEIVIHRISNVTETYSKVLPHEVEYVLDNTLPEGETRVITAGCDGEELCTATVTYDNGVEVNRNVIRSRVITEPVKEVIAVGSARPAEAVSGELYIGDGYIITAEGDILTYTGTMQAKATAYSNELYGGYGLTAIGTVCRVGAIAVDPKVIPYGTRMFVVSNDGKYIYGVCTAEDTGHPDFIHDNRIDLYYNTEAECVTFGVRNCTVYFLG